MLAPMWQAVVASSWTAFCFLSFQPSLYFYFVCHHRRSFVPRPEETRNEAGGDQEAFRRIPFLTSSQFQTQ